MKQGHGAAWDLCLFLTGAALGAAAALLYAPQTGQRTRRQLRRKVQEAQDYIDDVGEDLADRGRDLKDAADDAVRNLERKVRTVGS